MDYRIILYNLFICFISAFLYRELKGSRLENAIKCREKPFNQWRFFESFKFIIIQFSWKFQMATIIPPLNWSTNFKEKDHLELLKKCLFWEKSKITWTIQEESLGISHRTSETMAQ